MALPPSPQLIALAIHNSHSFYRGVLRGIGRYAHDRPHWRFIFVRPQDTPSTRSIFKRVHAAIVCVDSIAWCRFLLDTRKPVVNVDAVVPDLPMPRINLDDRRIGRMAARHFAERGLRTFGFVGQHDLLFSREREAAFRAALADMGHALHVFDVQGLGDLGPVSSLGDTYHRLGRWLSSLPHPVGVLSPDDLWGVEIVEACRQSGLRVPDDVAVLGVDNDDLYCTVSQPSLSSVIVPAEAVGVEAATQVEILLESGRRRLERDILLPPIGIAVRQSTDVLAVHDRDVVAALRFIRENSHKPMQVKDVLRIVPSSRRALERKVLQQVGLTLGSVIRRTRLERARQLLAETSLSIARVAYQSGYSDLRHIELAFRQELGMTPTQFRKNATGASDSVRK